MRFALVRGLAFKLCDQALRRACIRARRRVSIGGSHDKKEAAGVAVETRAQIDL